jgi:hypothetical protein
MTLTQLAEQQYEQRLDQQSDLRVLIHNLYEYSKGVRDLVLITIPCSIAGKATAMLTQRSISYHLVNVGTDKCNLFFGETACVDIVRDQFADNLSELSPEQDFMLGIMLGYANRVQYERYQKMCTATDRGPSARAS